MAVRDLLLGCNVVERLIPLKSAAEGDANPDAGLIGFIRCELQRLGSIESTVLNEDEGIAVGSVQADSGLNVDHATGSSA